MEFFRRLRRIVQYTRDGRLIIGNDRLGNNFFIVKTSEGRLLRGILPKDTTKPPDVHPLWGMWLRERLEKPPTPEEIEAFDHEQALMAQRIKMVEAKEAAERAQLALSRKQSDTEQNIDVSYQVYLRHIEAEEKKSSQEETSSTPNRLH
eukprot:TRINITY_DN1474_c0_g2_i1.p1 TRINITY_DN1474_c0_g2~~TRINITY_DN1474_c0_g2_i1.p1  ORF type:complete len:149 (-),score=5.16 TRINITY_DN1474_c0_g2_i1:93-539(-)